MDREKRTEPKRGIPCRTHHVCHVGRHRHTDGTYPTLTLGQFAGSSLPRVSPAAYVQSAAGEINFSVSRGVFHRHTPPRPVLLIGAGDFFICKSGASAVHLVSYGLPQTNHRLGLSAPGPS